MIAGSCIGAGMLGLPLLVGLVGFFPSCLLMFLGWGFMTYTSLLLIEVGSHFSPKANISTLSKKTLGRLGQVTSFTLFTLLFYAMLVAYISLSGKIIASISGDRVTETLGSCFFTLLFGLLIYFGKGIVDYSNRGLMIGKVLAFVGILLVSLEHFKPHLINYSNFKYSLSALPILVISFGFQNMNPVLMEYLGGDTKRVKRAILSGSLFVFVFYLIWNLIVLGIVPVEGKFGILSVIKQDKDASFALSQFIDSPRLGYFAEGLAFFAILTSFLGQSLGMVHFLADGLGIAHKEHATNLADRENPGLCVLTLLPPLFLALINPNLFYKAMNFAGGICAVILFGLIPIVMTWKLRYREKSESHFIVFGGKVALLFSLLFVLVVFLFQIGNMLNFEWIPRV